MLRRVQSDQDLVYCQQCVDVVRRCRVVVLLWNGSFLSRPAEHRKNVIQFLEKVFRRIQRAMARGTDHLEDLHVVVNEPGVGLVSPRGFVREERAQD